MATTLVTGATGFIGSHLSRGLAQRGDQVRVLVRSTSRVGLLAGVEHERASGGVSDRAALRRAMKGVDRVFHVAGVTSLRRADAATMHRINVVGTRNVLEAALDAGVERVVHTSSAVAIGPARPNSTNDETSAFTPGLGIPYVNSKHEAELEALRVAARGLDVVIVNPSFVIGPDAPRHGRQGSMGVIRRLLMQRVPAYIDGGVNIVDVRDVIDGMLAADERGEPGERYVLGARNYTIHRLFSDISRISGVPRPPLKLPGSLVDGGTRFAEAMGLPLPVVTDEARSAAMWWTYRNTKAKRDLGFSPRHHEETLEDAITWLCGELGERVGGAPGVQHRMLGAISGAASATGKLIGR